jgi:hypothetical protein
MKKTLSVVLDDLSTRVFYHVGSTIPNGPLGCHELSSQAVLLPNGWVFSSAEDWPDLEELLGLGILSEQARVIGLGDAVAVPLNSEPSDERPIAYNRLDFFAALFQAAARLAMPAHEQLEDVALAVSVPAYLFAEDLESRRSMEGQPEILDMLPLKNQYVREVGTNTLVCVDTSSRSLLNDMERAGRRVGFDRVHMWLGAHALFEETTTEEINAHLVKDPKARICIVEVGQNSIGFTPISRARNTPQVDGQVLVVKNDFRENLIAEILNWISGDKQMGDELQEALQIRFLQLGQRKECNFITRDKRIRVDTNNIQFDWRRTLFSISGDSVPHMNVKDWFVNLLTNQQIELSPLYVTHFLLGGMSISFDGIDENLAIVLQGDRKNKDYGLLDRSKLNYDGPQRVGKPRSDEGVHGLLKLAGAANDTVPSPFLASVNVKLTEPSGTPSPLAVTTRPALHRVIRRSLSAFDVTLESGTADAGSNGSFSVTVNAGGWESDDLVEVEFLIDRAEQVQMTVLVASRAAPCTVNPMGKGPQADLLGLGRYRLYLNPYHRTLCATLAGDGLRPASNVQLFMSGEPAPRTKTRAKPRRA